MYTTSFHQSFIWTLRNLRHGLNVIELQVTNKVSQHFASILLLFSNISDLPVSIQSQFFFVKSLWTFIHPWCLYISWSIVLVSVFIYCPGHTLFTPDMGLLILKLFSFLSSSLILPSLFSLPEILVSWMLDLLDQILEFPHFFLLLFFSLWCFVIPSRNFLKNFIFQPFYRKFHLGHFFFQLLCSLVLCCCLFSSIYSYVRNVLSFYANNSSSEVFLCFLWMSLFSWCGLLVLVSLLHSAKLPQEAVHSYSKVCLSLSLSHTRAHTHTCTHTHTHTHTHKYNKITMMPATNAPPKFCEYGWGLSAIEFHYSMIICSVGLFFGKFLSVIIMRFSNSAWEIFTWRHIPDC